MRGQTGLPQVANASQERVPSSSRLVVMVDKRLGAVGERVEVLPSLYGTIVMSYEKGCQVWLRPVDVQAWSACVRE
jgi:hypothetical protein